MRERFSAISVIWEGASKGSGPVSAEIAGRARNLSIIFVSRGETAGSRNTAGRREARSRLEAGLAVDPGGAASLVQR
jgi:hypothetical protein